MANTNAFGRFSRDLAIDLGTANTIVYISGRGIILDEPSVVAMRLTSSGNYGSILSIGAEARRMLGRTSSNAVAMRPLKEGVIADFEIAEEMMRYFIQQALGNRSFLRPRIVICIPSGASDIERRAVHESARAAGAKEVYLVPEPLAAALGGNLPIMEPTGCMVVDIGGGTTEVAVISLGGLVCSQSIRIAGDQMDEKIIQYIHKHHELIVGEQTAESLKRQLGCAKPFENPREVSINGRSTINGVPRQVSISSSELHLALKDTITAITTAIHETLEITPPELSADLLTRGILLCGGGALLNFLPELLEETTGLTCTLAESPMSCVARGAGIALETPHILQRIALN